MNRAPTLLINGAGMVSCARLHNRSAGLIIGMLFVSVAAGISASIAPIENNPSAPGEDQLEARVPSLSPSSRNNDARKKPVTRSDNSDANLTCQRQVRSSICALEDCLCMHPPTETCETHHQKVKELMSWHRREEVVSPGRPTRLGIPRLPRLVKNIPRNRVVK
jgi:hypothetical protein